MAHALEEETPFLPRKSTSNQQDLHLDGKGFGETIQLFNYCPEINSISHSEANSVLRLRGEKH